MKYCYPRRLPKKPLGGELYVRGSPVVGTGFGGNVVVGKAAPTIVSCRTQLSIARSTPLYLKFPDTNTVAAPGSRNFVLQVSPTTFAAAGEACGPLVMKLDATNVQPFSS